MISARAERATSQWARVGACGPQHLSRREECRDKRAHVSARQRCVLVQCCPVQSIAGCPASSIPLRHLTPLNSPRPSRSPRIDDGRSRWSRRAQRPRVHRESGPSLASRLTQRPLARPASIIPNRLPGCADFCYCTCPACSTRTEAAPWPAANRPASA